MTDIFKPETEDQVRDAVEWAIANKKSLQVQGGGSKSGLGHRVQADAMLDLSALNTLYSWEPEELVLTAGPGLDLVEMKAMLREKGQMMAFDPPSLAALYDNKGKATLGGTLAVNAAGSRRMTAGAARDHFLGVTAIGGRAEIFKAGGRVVKNVTGYDVCKIMAGSHGTLAAMTLCSIKVLPIPETEKSLIVKIADGLNAQQVMAGLMRGSYDISSLACLPKDGEYHIHARIEGVPPSVEARLSSAQKLIGNTADTQIVGDADESRAFWEGLGELTPLAGQFATAALVVKMSVKPSDFAAVSALFAEGSWFADWAGGLFYAALEKADDLSTLRDFVAAQGGHVTILRDNRGTNLPRFQPEPEAVQFLSARIKAAFDPEDRLNPGRMTGGEG